MLQMQKPSEFLALQAFVVLLEVVCAESNEISPLLFAKIKQIPGGLSLFVTTNRPTYERGWLQVLEDDKEIRLYLENGVQTVSKPTPAAVYYLYGKGEHQDAVNDLVNFLCYSSFPALTEGCVA